MSVRHSILAILNLGACHGYQLKHELETRTGQTFNINVGQIYSTLDRLERDALVTAQDPNDEGQIVYQITELGQVEVKNWFEASVTRTANNRDELAMKLALAVTLPAIDITALVNNQRLASLRTLQNLTAAKRSSDPEQLNDLAWLLVFDQQIFATEAELRWLDHVEGLLVKTAARGLTPSLEIQPSLAKRGRPTKQNGVN